MTSARHVPVRTMRRIVELASRAPSVHNTQPWRWRAAGNLLELFADRRYQLLQTDPEGRNLVISCGAALQHAQVAAEALGWRSRATRCPDPSRPDLLARLELAPSPPLPDAGAILSGIEKRCTDRRRFTAWPVPEERLFHLSQVVHQWGARAVPLVDASERWHAERLILQAARQQRTMPEMAEEQQAWQDRATPDGIPSGVLLAGTSPPAAYVQRFGTETPDRAEEPEVEGSDGLIVLFDTTDEPAAWLRAGEGLGAMWLTADGDGLSIVPLTQVIELPETGHAFQAEVLGGLAYPLIVVRVGWQAIGRSDLPRTPRRPVSDVLELA